MGALDEILHDYDVEILGDRKDFSQLEGRGNAWKISAIWASWATRLDGGNIAFYLPETHMALTTLTGNRVDYIRARVKGTTMILFLVGYSEGELPFGPFWVDEFESNMAEIPSQMIRKLNFAQKLQELLNSCDADRSWRWIASYKEAVDYFSIHRRTVMAVGKLVNINMADHDLTKTRLVQIALAFLWHWPGDKTPHELQLSGLAMDTVRAGHLEIEDHHPEFETANFGPVNVHKLFTDRVSVHLQKDPKDNSNGWDINLDFIPMKYREAWMEFVEKHKNIYLYSALEQALADAKVNFVNHRYRRSRKRRLVLDCC